MNISKMIFVNLKLFKVFFYIIGLTNFDLLEDFGRINWLGNFYIVLFHNIVFTVTAILCLGTKISSAVRSELYLRLRNFHRYSVFSK